MVLKVSKVIINKAIIILKERNKVNQKELKMKNKNFNPNKIIKVIKKVRKYILQINQLKKYKLKMSKVKKKNFMKKYNNKQMKMEMKQKL